MTPAAWRCRRRSAAAPWSRVTKLSNHIRGVLKTAITSVITGPMVSSSPKDAV